MAFPSAQQHVGYTLAAALAWGGALWVGVSPAAIADSPDSAPAELVELVTAIDTAANDHNVQDVMGFYSRSIEHSDGLSYGELERALTQFWFQYPEASYTTELTDWQRQGADLIAETETVITGTQIAGDRQVALTATVASRQRYQNGQIVEQTILSESSQMTSGDNPPTLSVNLPQQVNIGQPFSFDAIVQEPLGDRMLLGGAMESMVEADAYFDTTAPDLDLLIAGGLFKIGEAPTLPADRWISAVIIREDGITSITQRLLVGGDAQPLQSSSQ